MLYGLQELGARVYVQPDSCHQIWRLQKQHQEGIKTVYDFAEPHNGQHGPWAIWKRKELPDSSSGSWGALWFNDTGPVWYPRGRNVLRPEVRVGGPCWNPSRGSRHPSSASVSNIATICTLDNDAQSFETICCWSMFFLINCAYLI